MASGPNNSRDRPENIRETMTVNPLDANPARLTFSTISGSEVDSFQSTSTNASQASRNGRKGESMGVYVRVRPTIKGEIDYLKTVAGNKEIIVIAEDREHIRIRQAAEKSVINRGSALIHDVKEDTFKFTKVFGQETTQAELYNELVRPLCRSTEGIPMGTVFALFSFGATNGGKTYTMRGTHRQPGIIKRAIRDIFQTIDVPIVDDSSVSPAFFNQVILVGDDVVKQKRDHKERLMQVGSANVEEAVEILKKERRSALSSVLDSNSVVAPSPRKPNNFRYPFISVFVSYLEIYNNSCHDLFQILGPGQTTRAKLNVRENKDFDVVFVNNLLEIPVKSVEEALALYQAGVNNLHFAKTNLNLKSSRSHSIFMVKVVGFDDPKNPKEADVSVYAFCDLAGQERSEKAGTRDVNLNEAKRINSSISCLVHCMKATIEKMKVIPYRHSKLTHIMKNFFYAGRIAMLVNVSPSYEMHTETAAVLRSASLAATVSFTTFVAPEAEIRPEVPEETKRPGSGFTVTEWFRKTRRDTMAKLETMKQRYQDVARPARVPEEPLALPPPPLANGSTASRPTAGASFPDSTQSLFSDRSSALSQHGVHGTVTNGDRQTPGFEFQTPPGESDDFHEDLDYFKQRAEYFEKATETYKEKYLENKGKVQTIAETTAEAVRKEMGERFQKTIEDFRQKIVQSYKDGLAAGKSAPRNDSSIESQDTDDSMISADGEGDTAAGIAKERDELARRVQELSEQLEAALREKAQIDTLREQNEDLTRQLTEAREVAGECVALREQVQNQDQEIVSLRGALSEDQVLKDGLKAKDEKIAELTRDVAECTTEYTKVLETLREMDQKMKVLRDENEALQSDMELKELDAQNLIDADMEQLEEKSLQIQELEEKLAKRKHEWERERNKLHEEKMAMQSKIISLSDQLREASLAVADAKILKGELEILKLQEFNCETNRRDMEAARKEMDAARKEVEAMKSARQKDVKEKELLLLEKSTLQKNVDDLEREIKMLQANAKKEIFEKDKLSKDLEALKKLKQEADQKIANMSLEMAELRKQIESMASQKPSSSKRHLNEAQSGSSTHSPAPGSSAAKPAKKATASKRKPKAESRKSDDSEAGEDFVRPEAPNSAKKPRRGKANDTFNASSASESENEGNPRPRRQLGPKKAILDESASDSPMEKVVTNVDLRAALQAARGPPRRGRGGRPPVGTRGRGHGKGRGPCNE